MLERLTTRIREIAVRHASDYPGIAEVEPSEQLYAIECTLEGQKAAIEDWYRLTQHLGELLWGDQWKEKMLEAWDTVMAAAPRSLR